MKVLQILPELNSGGVERGTLEVAEFLVRNGHEAVVVSHGGRLVHALEKLGARHISMPVHRKSIMSLLLVRRLRELLEREKPDILHIRSRAPGWIAWLAWRKMDPATRPRLVTTVHGFYSVNAYSAVMTRGERVIAVSESVRTYILRNYPKVDEQKIRVIHRGVSLDDFSCRYKAAETWLSDWKAAHPELEGRILLLLPGRITRWKGQSHFIEMIGILKREGWNVAGLMIGETHPNKRPYEMELRALVERLGLEKDIWFLGHRADAKELMSISDVVYSLSTDPEAFGRVTLEAMALGKPVVAYRHGGVEEQLSKAFPQGLIPVGDVNMAVLMTKTIMETGAIPCVPVDFSIQHMLSATLDVYQSLMGSGNP